MKGDWMAHSLLKLKQQRVGMSFIRSDGSFRGGRVGGIVAVLAMK